MRPIQWSRFWLNGSNDHLHKEEKTAKEFTSTEMGQIQANGTLIGDERCWAFELNQIFEGFGVKGRKTVTVTSLFRTTTSRELSISFDSQNQSGSTNKPKALLNLQRQQIAREQTTIIVVSKNCQTVWVKNDFCCCLYIKGSPLEGRKFCSLPTFFSAMIYSLFTKSSSLNEERREEYFIGNLPWIQITRFVEWVFVHYYR